MKRMKRTTKFAKKLTSKRSFLLVALLAVLTTGCKPTFDTMEPNKLKWSLSVVAQASSADQKTTVETLLNNFALQHAITGQVDWVAAGAGAPALKNIVQKGTSDLVVCTADAGSVQTVAAQNDQIRFAVVGDGQKPTLDNVRNITIDRKRLLFLAGFLAAEANRESSEPFTVLVSKPLADNDPDWQMILAGSKLAGRHDIPVQIQTSALSAPSTGGKGVTGTTGTSDTTGTTATGTTTTTGSTDTASSTTVNTGATNAIGNSPVTQPLRLSGHSVLLLDNLTSDATAKIKSLGMKVVRTDLSDKPIAVQSNVIAQPAPILSDALQEEADLLAAGKWSGKQLVSLDPKHPYQLLLPGLFANKDIGTQLQIIEEQLANGSLKPETILAQ